MEKKLRGGKERIKEVNKVKGEWRRKPSREKQRSLIPSSLSLTHRITRNIMRLLLLHSKVWDSLLSGRVAELRNDFTRSMLLTTPTSLLQDPMAFVLKRTSGCSGNWVQDVSIAQISLTHNLSKSPMSNLGPDKETVERGQLGV